MAQYQRLNVWQMKFGKTFFTKRCPAIASFENIGSETNLYRQPANCLTDVGEIRLPFSSREFRENRRSGALLRTYTKFYTYLQYFRPISMKSAQ